MAVTPRYTVAEGFMRDLIAHSVTLPAFANDPRARELGGVLLRQALLELRDKGFIRTDVEFETCMKMIAQFEPIKI